MPRRKIPLGNIEEMLECVAEISDHFMVNAADMMPEEKKQEVFNFVLFLKSNGATGGKRNLSVKRRLDAFKTDQFFMADDFDETPECFKEYM